GYRGDAALRKLFGHPQGQRTPATAEFEHLLIVLQLRPQGGEPQHLLLGFGERLATFAKESAAVLEPRAEHALKKRRGYLVVLGIRGFGAERDRTSPHALGKSHEARAMGFRASLILPAQAPGEHFADHSAQESIRHQAALEQRLVPKPPSLAQGVFL